MLKFIFLSAKCYSSGGRSILLDCILIKKSEAKNLKEFKVIQRSETLIQLRIVLNLWKNQELVKKMSKRWEDLGGGILKMVELACNLRNLVQKEKAWRIKEGQVDEMWQELKATLWKERAETDLKDRKSQTEGAWKCWERWINK